MRLSQIKKAFVIPRDVSFIHVAGQVVRHAANKNITQIAASLTFTTVLGLVPLLAVVLSLFTAFPLFAEFQQDLENFLTSSLMPPSVSETVMSYLNQFAAKASRLTIVGTIALIVTSVLLLNTIDQALNTLWQVKRQRPLRQRILVYWAILSLGPILAGISLSASSILASHSANYLEALPMGLGLVLTLAPLLATTLGFMALFMFVPNCRVHWKDALIGGFAAAIALTIMRTGFTFYLSRFPSYTLIYGAFATLPIFLLWIYLSWVAVLSGAALAASLPALRYQNALGQNQINIPFITAIRALKVLWPDEQGQFLSHTADTLSQSTQTAADELETVLLHLQEMNYISMTETGTQDTGWQLACDPRKTDLAPLVHTLLIPSESLDPATNQALQAALIHVLQNKTVMLESVFETTKTLSQTPQLGQNKPV